MIRNIVFDFGGVLVDWNPEYVFKEIFRDRAELDYFLENICTPSWNEKQDAGRSLSEAVQTQQEKHPEYRYEIQLYYDEWPSMLGGDNARNIRAATELGFHTVHLRTDMCLKEELIQLGIRGFAPPA